jgi:hypothetical protein
MSCPNVVFLYNHSFNEAPNTGGESGDANWEVISTLNDQISFQGEDITDEDPLASKSIFVIPETGSLEVPKQLIAVFSEAKYKEVFLAGSEGGRYAYGVYIDGETASVPILQAWDDEYHDSYDFEVLGAGTPANSMLKAICTTNEAPAEDWEGTPIAGSGEENSLALDTEALSVAKTLYWNMKLVVPSTASPCSVAPVLSIYFTYS